MATYTVEYMIRHAVRVEADSDIQAEIEAFRQLNPIARRRIDKQRVCDEKGVPVRDLSQPCQIDSSWETPDLEWLKEHLK